VRTPRALVASRRSSSPRSMIFYARPRGHSKMCASQAASSCVTIARFRELLLDAFQLLMLRLVLRSPASRAQPLDAGAADATAAQHRREWAHAQPGAKTALLGVRT
jgi:hypothetical protein